MPGRKQVKKGEKREFKFLFYPLLNFFISSYLFLSWIWAG